MNLILSYHAMSAMERERERRETDMCMYTYIHIWNGKKIALAHLTTCSTISSSLFAYSREMDHRREDDND
jgi:hypothetical protein